MSVLVFAACKKMDVFSSTEIINTTIIEENSFNLHRSTDQVENALVNFIKRKNDSLHFIAKTVKQIGYPRWDKIINFKQKQKPTSKIENEGVPVFYVPFVRDNQNYVNASMVISVNQTDTAFYYLCDWQYKNRVHGSSQIDSTAEKYALFFMWLNNRSLGYKSFNITDSSLFLTMGSSGAKKITILEKNTDSIAANNMYTYFEECKDIYYCGTPDYCDNQPNGCDYLSGCGLCQKIYDICYRGWFDDGSTGGGENGGTGNNPPGIPPGNGGNAGSGGTPPDPCNGTPNNPAPFAKGNNTNQTNAVQPGCGGGGTGWEPVPIEDDAEYDPDLDPASYPESAGILLFEQDYRGQMSSQELVIFDGLIRYKQLQYLFNAKEALDRAQSLYPNSILNGNGDAFRHAYFSALNAKVLGLHLAKLLGDAHETFPNSNQLENTMDLFNNQFGRDLFVTLSQNGQAGHFFKETVMILLCNHKIPNGELKRLSPLGPSSEIILTTQLVATN
ncbi:MAG: hypothetical protein ABS68_06175 [Niastella sp. SCN 39-18]|nr:MAG: hypothetical protein ABS68_06175 [Niastella sp. SCN 39-18]OJW08579.1 MAG: hypothetical protein BGO53_10130 [Sphingobacteriales bacterium 39-19]